MQLPLTLPFCFHSSECSHRHQIIIALQAALDSSPSRELHSRTTSIHTPLLSSLEEDNKREKFLLGNQKVKKNSGLMDLQHLFPIKSCVGASCVSNIGASRNNSLPSPKRSHLEALRSSWRAARWKESIFNDPILLCLHSSAPRWSYNNLTVLTTSKEF